MKNKSFVSRVTANAARAIGMIIEEEMGKKLSDDANMRIVRILQMMAGEDICP